jgi:hypothetical protein
VVELIEIGSENVFSGKDRPARSPTRALEKGKKTVADDDASSMREKKTDAES